VTLRKFVSSISLVNFAFAVGLYTLSRAATGDIFKRPNVAYVAKFW